LGRYRTEQQVSQREQVYTMLKQAGSEGVTNGQFVNVSILRYSARIKELRDAGHRIEGRQITRGTFRYELLPTNQVCSVEEVGGDTHDLGESAAGGKLPPDPAPRGSSRGAEIQRRPVRWESAAATSGEGVENPGTGGGAPPHPVALPLFDLPRSGRTSHYEEAA
jgi:hypothetical protein